MATIVLAKTMTSLRLRANFKIHIVKLKSLQLNLVKISRKSYPRVGKAFVLNNPLYNLKISDYFEEIRCLTWTRVVFHTENTVKSLIFNVKSLHPILIYFT